MKVVFDTNVLISGLLWPGIPNDLLRSARDGHYVLVISEAILKEVEGVLGRSKFAGRIRQLGTSVEALVVRLGEIATIVSDAPMQAGKAVIIAADPSDDVFIHCAINTGAEILVSGDGHLLDLGNFGDVRICTAREFWEVLYEKRD